MSLLGVKGFLSTKNVSDYFTQVSKLLETFSANVVIDFFFQLVMATQAVKAGSFALCCVLGQKIFSHHTFLHLQVWLVTGEASQILSIA